VARCRTLRSHRTTGAPPHMARRALLALAGAAQRPRNAMTHAAKAP
jgi:hypothetical protein